MKRSDFIKLTAVAGLSSKLALAVETTNKPIATPGPLPRRPLGKTGEMLSIIGLGGVSVKNEPQSVVDRVVAESVDAGVNYFDVAPHYGDAEILMGSSLKPYRKNIYLACKTMLRDRAGAEKELSRSLKRLQTDYFDLYQLHYLNSPKDIDTVFGPGGAMEILAQARKDGRVRHLGFSAHTVEAALAAMDNFDFDTIMFPLNVVSWYELGFGPQVIGKAAEKGMGIMAIKAGALCGSKEKNDGRFPKCWYIPRDNAKEAALGYYFALSLPITSALPPGEVELFRLGLKLATSFIPLTDKEKAGLAQAAKGLPSIFRYPAWGT